MFYLYIVFHYWVCLGEPIEKWRIWLVIHHWIETWIPFHSLFIIYLCFILSFISVLDSVLFFLYYRFLKSLLSLSPLPVFVFDAESYPSTDAFHRNSYKSVRNMHFKQKTHWHKQVKSHTVTRQALIQIWVFYCLWFIRIFFTRIPEFKATKLTVFFAKLQVFISTKPNIRWFQ